MNTYSQRSEAVAQVNEDLWNGGGLLVPDDLAAAIERVTDYLPSAAAERVFAGLVGLIAEQLVKDAAE